MGPVIPHFMTLDTDGYSNGGSFNNDRLRVGEVQEIVYPDNPRSVSKKFREYSVFVQHRANGTATTRLYEHCVLMNSFAGLADKLDYTLRPDATAAKLNQGGAPGPGLGSKVLILCINGENNAPIIIGGLRDAGDAKDTDQGHHLDFEFNGVAIAIDKDGQLLLSVKGATDARGKAAKGTATDKLPTTVKIEKDGRFTVATKDGKTSIVVQQTGEITVTAEKEAKTQSGKNTFSIKTDGTVHLNAEKSVKIVSKGPVTVDAKGVCTVLAKSIELGAAGLSKNPAAGVVLGHHIDTLTGLPFWLLGAASGTVFGKK